MLYQFEWFQDVSSVSGAMCDAQSFGRAQAPSNDTYKQMFRHGCDATATVSKGQVTSLLYTYHEAASGLGLCTQQKC